MDKFYDKLIETIDNIYSKTGLQPTEIRCNEKLERRIIDDYYSKLNSVSSNYIRQTKNSSEIFGIKYKLDGSVPNNTFRLVYENITYKYDDIFTFSFVKSVDVSEVEYK